MAGAGLRTRSRQYQFSISQNRLVISVFGFPNVSLSAFYCENPSSSARGMRSIFHWATSLGCFPNFNFQFSQFQILNMELIIEPGLPRGMRSIFHQASARGMRSIFHWATSPGYFTGQNFSF
jgi:hypothetical protein